ncbi:MAG: hypothetical protein E7275_12165 [Pseudobutyrivibrio sp.]|uniref:CdiA C-terminal domain-containing protein n=1 Tax=Pseudobutyrivibrio sp. TaxID=2014367 RepID=UPI0025CC82ED|nr:hypothetical protein [Pseudobutyrivibrio sp.]MBE5905020.1 hypothetical protein [Pseudobutyrivibrio sp.]
MQGRIDISNLKNPPEKHELATAKYFASLGKDIVFIQPSNIPNVHRPDIVMDGIEWEIKSPQGKSRRTIQKNFCHAIEQSKNIIFDLRRTNLQEDYCISELERQFEIRHAKRLLVIKKNGVLLKYPF